MTQKELVEEALSLVTPGKLTYGNSKRILDLCKRFALTDELTEKQETELTELVAKGRHNG